MSIDLSAWRPNWIHPCSLSTAAIRIVHICMCSNRLLRNRLIKNRREKKNRRRRRDRTAKLNTINVRSHTYTHTAIEIHTHKILVWVIGKRSVTTTRHTDNCVCVSTWLYINFLIQSCIGLCLLWPSQSHRVYFFFFGSSFGRSPQPLTHFLCFSFISVCDRVRVHTFAADSARAFLNAQHKILAIDLRTVLSLAASLVQCDVVDFVCKYTTARTHMPNEWGISVVRRASIHDACVSETRRLSVGKKTNILRLHKWHCDQATILVYVLVAQHK